MKQGRNICRARAFTLIELLVVVAMIGLIMAAVTPMVFGTIASTRLTSAGEGLMGQLSLARQYAVSQNRAVEVCFYYYEDPETPGSKDQFRAIALMEAQLGTTSTSTSLRRQITDTFYLPAGMVISDDPKLSPLLNATGSSLTNDQEQVVRRGQARYRKITFNSDGSTDIASLFGTGAYQPSDSYLTLGEENVLERLVSGIPDNFYTIQINADTARLKPYRP
jgi:uncharacterized protein (TIGR02596 family)